MKIKINISKKEIRLSRKVFGKENVQKSNRIDM